MSSAPSKLTIVASTKEDCDEISAIVKDIPNIETSVSTGTLGQMNGTAVAMMQDTGIVLTRLSSPTEEDIAAIEDLAQSDDRRASMIVISDADMPLSAARRLIHAGVSEVLPAPAYADDLSVALQHLTRPKQLPAVWTGKTEGRIISVTRARGGNGATTVAVNLASALAASQGVLRKKEGAKVALVDLDVQFGAVASFLDLPARDTLYDLAAGGDIPDETYLDEEMESSSDGVRVLTAPSRFVPLDALSGEQVGAILDTLRKTYDYVIVDLPHGLVDWVQAVIDRSDRVMLVTDSAVPSIRQSKRLIDFYQEESPGIPIMVVVNHEAKPMLQAKHHKQAAKLLDRPFNVWLPDDPKVARASIDRGVPLASTNKRCALSKSIAQLARTVREDFMAPPKSNTRH